ncbi:hypothetical protein LOY91_006784, partial [Ophidiomyces ophidiicola]
QICVATLYCLLAAGIIFGYAALKPLLIKEGIYREYCTSDELQRKVDVCFEQEIRLNFMFTVAVVATNICALPVGSILDICGPRATGSIGSIIIALGALIFAYSGSFPYDRYLTGYSLLSIGGPFIFISSFHLSNTFPKNSGLLLSMLMGAFDCSSGIFLQFRLVHEKANGTVTIKSLFLIYLCVPGFILTCQVLLMPSQSYSTARELLQHAEETLAEDESAQDCSSEEAFSRYRGLVSKINSLIGNKSGLTDGPTSALGTDPAWGAMHTSSASEQMRSPWFVLIAFFTVIQMLRLNYFISTIRPQYEYLLSSERQAQILNDFFDFFLPIGGIVAIPFIGIILDHYTVLTTLTLLVCGATLVGILGCISHSFSAAYANIILFVLYRPYFYSVISDYSAKIFGFQTFGKVYGLMICLAGVGNFLQSPLDILTMKILKGNPLPVNIGLTSVGAVAGGSLIVFTRQQVKKILGPRASGRSKRSGVGDTERLLPGSLRGQERAYDSLGREQRSRE